MGRGPIRHPPRHLAPARRSGTDAREHQVAEWLLAAVAIVLTAAVLVSSMFDRPGRSRSGSGDAAAPTTPAATTPPPAGGPAEAPPTTAAGLGDWRAIGGTRVERTAAAPDLPAAAGFTGSGRADQGMALAELRRCTKGRTYAVTVRLRASRPATLVEVTLLEVAGGRRYAADTVGAALPDRDWRRVQVTHQAHLRGTVLALEVVLPRGSPGATVQVDDLQVATSGP